MNIIFKENDMVTQSPTSADIVTYLKKYSSKRTKNRNLTAETSEKSSRHPLDILEEKLNNLEQRKAKLIQMIVEAL